MYCQIGTAHIITLLGLVKQYFAAFTSLVYIIWHIQFNFYQSNDIPRDLSSQTSISFFGKVRTNKFSNTNTDNVSVVESREKMVVTILAYISITLTIQDEFICQPWVYLSY